MSRNPHKYALKHLWILALMGWGLLVIAQAQVSIGGTLGFTAQKASGSTAMTLSSNSTTSTSAGYFSANTAGTQDNGLISVTAGVQRNAWTKDGTSSSYDIQTLQFKNGGSSTQNSNDIGTFSLTFTPTGGSAITLGTWDFTLDNANTYSWSLQNGDGASYSNAFGVSGTSDNFGTQFYSSFVYSGTTVFYRVLGTNVSGGTYNEGSSYSQNIGFQITNIQPIPEPSAYALAGPVVLFGAMGVRKLRRKTKVAAPAA